MSDNDGNKGVNWGTIIRSEILQVSADYFIERNFVATSISLWYSHDFRRQ